MPYGILGQIIMNLIRSLQKKESRSKQSNINNFKPKLTSTMKIFLAFFIAIIVLLLVFAIATAVVPSILWYNQLGYSNVFWIQMLVPLLVFVSGFVIALICTTLSLVLTFKLRPKYALTTMNISQIEEFKTKVSHRKKMLFFLISATIAIFFGLSLLPGTNDFMLLFASNQFGQADPVFHIDTSFYVFMLPGINRLVSSTFVLFIIMLLTSLAEGYVFGQIAFQGNTTKKSSLNINISKGLRFQVCIYASIILILGAVKVFLSRFYLLIQTGSRITGASWTDVNVRIPVLNIVAVLLVITAVFCLIGGVVNNAKPIAILGVSICAIAFFAGVIAPNIVQNLKVTPNAQELEKPYIQNNIEATKSAFNLNNIEISQYNATVDAKKGALKNDTETTASIRLLDPQIMAPTFRQLQQNKQYYGFQDTLSVDKYNFNGKSHDTVISARELDLSGSDQRNWINDTTVFTHGYGLVAAFGNQATVDGRPQFFEKDIPSVGDISAETPYEPRIYFSNNAPKYSIVGSKTGEKWEFDYPEAPENVTFQGNGGPKLTNIVIKLMFAIRFGSYQMFFSDRVNSDSQILYDRDPATRVEKVAPYLTLDGRVYPAVVDGHIKWIIDAYTTTNNYPYSARIDLGLATKDTLTETSSSITGLDSKYANYVRNSVKATVDAYDGSVDLYAWDPSDPILKAWSKIYGQNLKPLSDISGNLMSHIRYPENLFKIQRSLLGKYHVNNASAFFSGEDFWQTPNDPTTSGTVKTTSGTTESGVKQPPYYLTLQMPGQNAPTFSLTSTFIPGGSSKREILTGFLSADSDAGDTPGVIGANYGKLRLLELPKNTTVPGPGQAQNNFNSNADAQKELNLLGSGSSIVQRGNLLTLPIGGGLVYVQPVYVRSTGSTSFPLLKKILVAFGDKVGFSDTLDGALNQVFGGDSGVDVGKNQNIESGQSTTQNGNISEGSANLEESSDGSSNSQTDEQSSNENSESSNNSSNSSQDAVEEAKKAIKAAEDALEKAKEALDKTSK